MSSVCRSRIINLEHQLGLPSTNGILRALDRRDLMAKYRIWKEFTEGIQELTDDIVNGERWSLDQMRSTTQLIERSAKLFHRVGSGIWPDERGDEKTPWLAMSAEFDLDGRYPKDLFYSDDEDREFLLETFNENIRLKCEGRHARTLTKSGAWKYVSSRKRKRTSTVAHVDYILDVEPLDDDEDHSALVEGDDEPDPRFDDETSSELSEYTIVSQDQQAEGGCIPTVELMASQTLPSTGQMPLPRMDTVLADQHVRRGSAEDIPKPPTAPRSMLTKQINRAFIPTHIAPYPPPIKTRYPGPPIATQSLTYAPGDSSMVHTPARGNHPRHVMGVDQPSYLPVPFSTAFPAKKGGFPEFPMYDQQSCPSRADYASAIMGYAPGTLEALGRQNEATSAGSVHQASTIGVSRRHTFGFGNVDRFVPNYHPSLPLHWRRGQGHDGVVYHGERTEQYGSTPSSVVQIPAEDALHISTDLNETEHRAVDARDITSKSHSPDTVVVTAAGEHVVCLGEAQVSCVSHVGPLTSESTLGSGVEHTTPATTAPLASSPKLQKSELKKKRCDACTTHRRRSSVRVHFSPNTSQSVEPPEVQNGEQEATLPGPKAAATDLEPGSEAVVSSHDVPNSPVLHGNEEMLEDEVADGEHNLEDNNRTAEAHVSIQEEEPSPDDQTENTSRSPEGSHDEGVKNERHDIKREPLNPGMEDVADMMADEGTHANPIDLESTDNEDDMPSKNLSCVEVDAGDGVAFCTSFEICKSTEEFFAFVFSLVPPDIQAVHAHDTIGSVLVRFANPTKLDTSKMRVYRQRGGPTIMRLNDQLNAPMESGEAGLKFIVEWQRGGSV